MIKRITFILVAFIGCCSSGKLFAANDAAQQQLQQLLQAASQTQQNLPNPNTAQAQANAAQPNIPQPAPSQTAGQPNVVNSPIVAPPIAPVGANTVTAVDTGSDVGEEAFAAMTQSQLPLTPPQIRTLHKLFDETQRAVGEYPGVPPKPTSSSLVVNLSPGATPPVIRLLNGYVTSLVFVDSTGAPWPVRSVDNGDPKDFNITWDQKDSNTSTLLVQAITQYKAANLAVQLEGLNTPVMLTLLPGQAAVDYRVDLHVPGIGPLALPIQNGLPPSASPALLNVLSGIPPQGSRQLRVSPGGYAEVWILGSNLYIRSRATVLSPAWIATMSSSDGTHAYKMPVAPMIIVSLNGKPVNLSLQGY